MYDLMQRYVGHRISITTYSHTRLIGEVASIHADGVLLIDTVEVNELEDQGWYAQICDAHPEDDTRPHQVESLISWHAILVATCLDDDIAPPPSAECKTKKSIAKASVIVNSGRDTAEHDAKDGNRPGMADRFRLEIGAQLVPLMAADNEKPLVKRVKDLRREHAEKVGWSFPPLRIRDNLELNQNGYRVLIDGCQVAAAQVQPGRYLAISNGETTDSLDGQETTDPVFGLTAYWVDSEQRAEAEQRSYTVVDATTVIITHLGEVLRRHAAELLGYEQVQELLDNVEEVAPTAVREVIDGIGAVRTTHYVLRRLLEEGVSLRGLVAMLECLGHHKRTTSDLEKLTGAVRASIGRQICEPFRDERGRVRAVVFHPLAERRMTELCNTGAEPATLERLLECLSKRFCQQVNAYEDTALLIDTSIRHCVWKQINRALPDVRVIAYQEIPSDLLLEPVDLIELDELEPGKEVSDASIEDTANQNRRKPDDRVLESARTTIPKQPR